MEQHFIIKNEIRPDGVVNNSVVSRSTFASGLAEYYAQCSKAPMNENFTDVHVMLTDSNLEVIKVEHIKAAYVEPAPEEPAIANDDDNENDNAEAPAED